MTTHREDYCNDHPGLTCEEFDAQFLRPAPHEEDDDNECSCQSCKALVMGGIKMERAEARALKLKNQGF